MLVVGRDREGIREEIIHLKGSITSVKVIISGGKRQRRERGGFCKLKKKIKKFHKNEY